MLPLKIVTGVFVALCIKSVLKTGMFHNPNKIILNNMLHNNKNAGMKNEYITGQKGE